MVKQTKGFSLVELLIAIGIVGLILTIVVFILNGKQKETRDLKRVSDIQALRTALEFVKNQTGSYERSFCELGVVSACGKNADSELVKFLPGLSALNDPMGATVNCNVGSNCANGTCNYAFVKVDADDYGILMHLEKGVNEFSISGCYLVTPLGIKKL